MSYSGKNFIDFYILDQVFNSFYHVYERTDWKIAVLPYQELQTKVNSTIAVCDAFIAEPGQRPSIQQIKAMTDVLQWGKELVADNKYQLELYFDPQYRNTSFIDCFDNKITAWVDHYNRSQQHSDAMGLLSIFLFISAATLLCGGAFFAYHQWKKNCSSNHEGWSIALFGDPQKEDEKTALVEVGDMHQCIKNDVYTEHVMYS